METKLNPKIKVLIETIDTKRKMKNLEEKKKKEELKKKK